MKNNTGVLKEILKKYHLHLTTYLLWQTIFNQNNCD